MQKKVMCENIGKGKVRIEGHNHFATLGFSDGTCDRVATIPINGRTPKTIFLR